MPYVKLDTDILESSLWPDRDARDLFVAALLSARLHTYADPVPEIAIRSNSPTGWLLPAGCYGFARTSPIALVDRGLADRFHALDLERGLAALERLASPDPYSRTTAHDGRRLVRVEGGIVVLNFAAYRDRDHTLPARQARHRAKTRESRLPLVDQPEIPAIGNGVTPAEVTQSDPDPDPDRTPPPAAAPAPAPAELVIARIDQRRIELGERPLPPSQRVTRHIVARLEEGVPLEDLLRAVDLRAAECKTNAAAIRWFDATSPFTGPGPRGPGGWSVSAGMVAAARRSRRAEEPITDEARALADRFTELAASEILADRRRRDGGAK